MCLHADVNFHRLLLLSANEQVQEQEELMLFPFSKTSMTTVHYETREMEYYMRQAIT